MISVFIAQFGEESFPIEQCVLSARDARTLLVKARDEFSRFLARRQRHADEAYDWN